jgi:UDP-N-acetylglucosamine 2-epimerase (hydrolysing)
MKTVLFITGTRADYGKIKSLISILIASKQFKVTILITGMHLMKEFGDTYTEIENDFPFLTCKSPNQKIGDSMSTVLSNSIKIFTQTFTTVKPDMVIIHGDRIEALAGAVSSALMNILIGHIEGGEVSGTIDESIRHAVSKFSHIHFVSNQNAKNRLIQLGEISSSIFIIGSPDLDFIFKKGPLSLKEVLKRYEIPFSNYAILLYHPVTTEYDKIRKYSKILVNSIIKSKKNYIVVNPNNDFGYKEILHEYKKFQKYNRIKVFPSIRFEYFVELLKHADFIIGNSSAGIHEAPALGVASINIGNRQSGRFKHLSVFNSDFLEGKLIDLIQNIPEQKNTFQSTNYFGSGQSDKKFLKIMIKSKIWNTNIQKVFQDI